MGSRWVLLIGKASGHWKREFRFRTLYYLEKLVPLALQKSKAASLLGLLCTPREE